MKLFCIFMTLALTLSASAADPTLDSVEMFQVTESLVERAEQMAEDQAELELSPVRSLRPHYLVYGFELSKSAGIGDFFEVSGSLGVEFHFAREED
jgi:hypothetical protein